MSLTRLLYRSFLLNLLAFALAGCVWVVSPTLPRSAIVTPTDTATTPAAKCRPYRPPADEAVPKVPNFTAEERTDPDKFSLRLTAYVDTLREYIARQAKLHAAAYRRYQRHCAAADDE